MEETSERTFDFDYDCRRVARERLAENARRDRRAKDRERIAMQDRFTAVHNDA